MMSNHALQTGQTILYDGAFWRVDLVSPSRARIVPLVRRHITLGDREFEVEAKGVNISAGSCVEIVEDVERTKIAMEERKLAAEQLRIARTRQEILDIAEEEQAVEESRQRIHHQREVLQTSRASTGWWLASGVFPDLAVGSQAAQMLDYIKAHPGLSTEGLAAGMPSIKNTPQCLSRLKLTGRIEKV